MVAVVTFKSCSARGPIRTVRHRYAGSTIRYSGSRYCCQATVKHAGGMYMLLSSILAVDTYYCQVYQVHWQYSRLDVL